MDDEKLKDVKEDLKVIRKIGEIEIKVFRTSEGTSVEAKPATSLASSMPAKVHEKALKGDTKSHGIS
jgi:hypothetical protein